MQSINQSIAITTTTTTTTISANNNKSRFVSHAHQHTNTKLQAGALAHLNSSFPSPLSSKTRARPITHTYKQSSKQAKGQHTSTCSRECHIKASRNSLQELNWVLCNANAIVVCERASVNKLLMRTGTWNEHRPRRPEREQSCI